MLGLQGNTKQQSTLSTAVLSLSSDLYAKMWRHVPAQYMYSYGALKMHLRQGFSGCHSQHSAGLQTSPVSLPLSLHSQPSNMSRHGSTIPCSRGTFSVHLSSYTFNHIHSFRSFMKFRCCGMNFEHNKHKYLPSNAHMDPWIQLKLSSRCGGPSQELFPHPSSSLSNSSSGWC